MSVVGVLLAQRFLVDLQRLAEQRLGLGVVALGLVQQGQVVQAGGVVGVLLAQRLLLDLQRLPVERLGLGVVALVVVQQCQVVQAGGVVGVLSRPASASGSPAPAGRAARPWRSRPGRVQHGQVVRLVA